MVELLSEPLYILAMVQQKISLRVAIEASATVMKILATLALLWSGVFPEAIALSLAQVPISCALTQQNANSTKVTGNCLARLKKCSPTTPYRLLRVVQP